MQYLYNSECFSFMDNETYEQSKIPAGKLRMGEWVLKSDEVE